MYCPIGRDGPVTLGPAPPGRGSRASWEVEMPRSGRPPKPVDEQVTIVRLANRHVAILDGVIRDRARRDLKAVEVTEPAREIPGTGGMTVTRTKIGGIDFAVERRRLVSSLIDEYCTDEALHPTRVKPLVPPGDYGDIDLAAIDDWSARESVRLTESAPIAVRIALAQNELRQKRRDSTPEQYLESLRAAIRTRSGNGDDEKTT